MSEAAVGAKPKAAGESKLSPAEQKAARVMGHTYFVEVMKQHKPEMTKEQRQAEWRQNQKQWVGLGRRVLRALVRQGVTVNVKEV